MRLGTLFGFLLVMLPCLFGVAISMRFLLMPVLTDAQHEEAVAWAESHGVVIYAPNMLDRVFDWGGLLVTSCVVLFLSLSSFVSVLRRKEER